MRNRTRTMLTGVVLCVAGAGSSPAMASGVQVYTSRGHAAPGYAHAGCGTYSCGTAGTLQINGCQTTISAGASVDAEIVRAFRRAGYDASCSQGRVVVRFGHRKPALAWVGRDYSARFHWDRDCLIITTFRNQCRSCDSCRGVTRHEPGWNRPVQVCPPTRNPGWGWGVRWSSRSVGNGCR